ncbi:hypothetical protein ASPZODRAFT_134586, partial [Penicilliopsis zonata CBS 506.65]
MPTFIVFEKGRVVNTVQGANPQKLNEVVRKLASEASKAGPDGGEGASGEGGEGWLGAAVPKGYSDITDQVNVKGLELLNRDAGFGDVRVLFDTTKPSALLNGKNGKGKAVTDWVESDTDEQLMLYIPLQSTSKVHSLHITSLPPSSSEGDDDDDDDDDETPLRPQTIQLYTNRTHVLSFDDAEDIPAVQTVTLQAGDWDAKTGTAKVDLRFVKFQNVSSLVVFFVDGDGDGEKIRVDRVRILGEAGEKREMGKLQKIGDEQGE